MKKELSTDEFVILEQLEEQLFEDNGKLKQDASILNYLRYKCLVPKYWVSTKEQREGKVN